MVVDTLPMGTVASSTVICVTCSTSEERLDMDEDLDEVLDPMDPVDRIIV